KNKSLVSLNNLDKEACAEIVSVKKDQLAARLSDMGLYPGQLVQVLYNAPLGDPLAIQVGDYVLSLRKSEAELITVKKL
ncbi:MAG: FeoA family protein, partial [Cyclobacteriaceae bacterium]